MATFVTIGYGDRAGHERTDASLREAAHDQEARLRAAGALVGIAGPPVTMRNPDASRADTSGGTFMRSDLPVAG